MTFRCRDLAFVFIVVAIAGCRGNQGDSCQQNKDCKSALVCCKSTGSSLDDRGVCEATCMPVIDDTTPDANTPGDTLDANSTVDANGDAG